MNWGAFLIYGVPSGDLSSCGENTGVRTQGQGTGARPGDDDGSHLHRDCAALLLGGSGKGSGQGHSRRSQGLRALLLAFLPGFAATLPLPTHTGHFALSCVGHIVGDLIEALRLAVRKATGKHLESEEVGRHNRLDNCG